MSYSRISKVFFLLTCCFLHTGSVLSQEYLKDNYTGNWISDSSWVSNASPGTTSLDIDILVEGYITAHNCLEFNKGHIEVFDTLVVVGDFSLGNNADLTIHPNGILIIYGNYTSNNQVEVENMGLMVVTGDFRMLGSDNLGTFVNKDGELFIHDSEPELKSGDNYQDLWCITPSNFPTSCMYGMISDLENDLYRSLIYSTNIDEHKDLSCNVVAFDVNDAYVCFNEPVIVENLSRGINSNSVFRWDFGEGAQTQIVWGFEPHEVYYTVPGTKTIRLELIEDNLVVDFVEITIEVDQKPLFTIEDVSRCGSGEIVFDIILDEKAVCDFSLNGGASVLNSGLYQNNKLVLNIDNEDKLDLSIRVEDTVSGCISKWEIASTAESYPIPNVEIIGDQIICEGNDNNYSLSGFHNRILWHDGSILSDYTTNKVETISVTVVNEFGCQGGDTLILEPCESTTQMNSLNKESYSFTPNQDGVNDTWKIDSIIYYPKAKILVFDRTGNTVFESNGNYQNDWDGTFHGSTLQMDSYYFLIDLSSYNKESIKGIVTILLDTGTF